MSDQAERDRNERARELGSAQPEPRLRSPARRANWRVETGAGTATPSWQVLAGGSSDLPNLEQAPPPRRIWSGIESALRAEGLIRE